MYMFSPAYPTKSHEKASAAVLEYFSHIPHVKAVLLANSCARGKATNDSCLDMLVMLEQGLDPQVRDGINNEWTVFQNNQTVFAELKEAGLYAEIDLEYSDGIVHQSDFHHGWMSGPDHFELEIGNLFAYSVPLWEKDGYFSELKNAWLPYYDKQLRMERLEMVLMYFHNNIDHIDPYLKRGLYFHCFKRLQNAFGEFLQALFIARAIYPISYDKHIREQIVDILQLDELYPMLPKLFEISKFESHEQLEKAKDLKELMAEYVTSIGTMV
jgi:hypothetical protein